MRAFGASEMQITALREQLLARVDAERALVWPEHWHAAQLFLAMSTQWRAVAGFAGLLYTGLDYAVLPAIEPIVAEAVPTDLRRQRPEVFEQLRVMERAAIDCMQEGADRGH